MLCLDTESTGVDGFHGCRPFIVTSCDENWQQRTWRWDVDPLSREVRIPRQEFKQVLELIHDSTGPLVGQNIKFDYLMLARTADDFGMRLDWPWDRTEDTIVAGHLLASNLPHNLTDMCVQYLGENISEYEDVLEAACKKSRNWARSNRKDWQIAREGHPMLPSCKGSKQDKNDRAWKFDSWLPHEVAKVAGYPRPKEDCEHQWDALGRPKFDWYCRKCKGHRWWTVCQEYADKDSEATLALWQRMEGLVRQRGLWEIYRESMKLPEILADMETRSVTVLADNLAVCTASCERDIERMERLCKGIARSFGYDLEVPKGGRNDSLFKFIFEVMKLPVVGYAAKGKSANPSMDKEALAAWETSLPAGSKERLFIHTFSEMKKRQKALGDLESYSAGRFGIPDPVHPGVLHLHPHLNQTGTATTRFSCKNPNEQNVSQKTIGGDEDAFSLRKCFGPAPGREWWSLDYQNLELRIPAYVSGEEAMIDLFENPDKPPYYGGYHLLTAHIIHTEKFEECLAAGLEFNTHKRYKPLYKSTKNGNFANQYSAGQQTADRAYGVQGAQARLHSRLPRIKALSQDKIAQARRHGFIETIPDKTVNPSRGYPLLCSRTAHGGILSTTPLSYFVQGTAGLVCRKAMTRCYPFLQRVSRERGEEYYIMMNVHDELVFDMPARGQDNLDVVMELKRLMEESGTDISVPLRVSVSYHPVNWAEEEKIDADWAKTALRL